MSDLSHIAPVEELAASNAISITQLFYQMRRVAASTGKSAEYIAEQTGTTPEYVEAVLLGEMDLTLRDLEALLAALNARILFYVIPQNTPAQDAASTDPDVVKAYCNKVLQDSIAAVRASDRTGRHRETPADTL